MEINYLVSQTIFYHISMWVGGSFYHQTIKLSNFAASLHYSCYFYWHQPISSSTASKQQYYAN